MSNENVTGWQCPACGGIGSMLAEHDQDEQCDVCDGTGKRTGAIEPSRDFIEAVSCFRKAAWERDHPEMMRWQLQIMELVRAGNAGVKVLGEGQPPRKPTDPEVAEWAERHDLRGSATDLRCAFEDAQTLHMADGVPVLPGQQQEGGKC